MTASSVELFACRVQVMGLPQTNSTSAATAPTASLQTPPRRPPLDRIRGISRNLFGSPQPGEINNMFQQETRRYHSYVMQRYNIDINALRSQGMATSVSDVVVDSVPSQQPTHLLPTLIANELKEHEHRLQEEECTVKRVATVNCDAKSPIMQCKPLSSPSSEMTGAGKRVQTSTSNVERQKPYSRQKLLTESYNLRKNKLCMPSSSSMSLSESQSSSAATASQLSSSSPLSTQSVDIAKTYNLLDNTHSETEVLSTPQAVQIDLQKDASNELTAATEGTTEENKSVDQKKTNDKCDKNSQRQRCANTTLSLKFVVTTTSTTPPENKHQA
ncbi:uncharacterized protein [Musca autumnalis]|uniref:uncharacterized protein n=1 Tax=Musca autumnalis TaxID=221902 RepID=UPI003CE84E89